MTQLTCPRCGFINAFSIPNPNPPPATAKFCPNCGFGNGVQIPGDYDTAQ